MNNIVDFDLLEELSPNVFLICIGNQLYILKKAKKLADHSDPFEKLLYPLLALRFRKELAINIYLMGIPNSNRTHPSLLQFKKNKHMIFEYIRPTENTTISHTQKIIDSYLQFQNSLSGYRFSFFTRSYNLNLSVLYLSIRLFFLNKSFKTFITIFQLLIKLNKNQTKIVPLVLHKDLKFKKNTVWGNGSKLYFIDFETVTIEKRWILLDVVDMAFNPLNYSLDLNLINEYLKSIDTGLKLQINVEAQIRFALLRRAIGSYERELGHENKLYFFLNSILLRENGFKEWVKSHGE